MDRTFPSKIDAWLKVVTGLAGVLWLYTFVVIWKTPDVGARWVSLGIGVVGLALPVWTMGSTRYTLTDTELVVQSGPFRWRVTLADITDVRPTHNPLSSPALSLDRLQIAYGKGREILISPEERDEFLRELEARRGKKAR